MLAQGALAMSDYPAPDLLALARVWLRQTYPDAVIVPEMSVASWGGALIDVAAITPTELIGVEIKGQGDSGARLAIQGMNYSAVASKMFLLPTPSLEATCKKKLPRGWNVLKIVEGVITPPNYIPDDPHFPTSSHRLLEMCWAPEVRSLARYLHADVMGARDSHAVGRKIAETIPLRDIRLAVFMVLRARDWTRGGTSPKKVEYAA